MKDLVWLVPLLPFLGALVNGVVLRNRLSRRGVTNVACGSVLLSLLVGMALVLAPVGYRDAAASAVQLGRLHYGGGGDCWKDKAILVTMACDGCETECGSTDGELPLDWEMRAVSLID